MQSLLLLLACLLVALISSVQCVPELPISKSSTHNIRAFVESSVIDNSGRTAVFTLSAGETKKVNDGQYALSSANGRVWHDLNGDGNDNEVDKKATALEGVPVQLYNENGTIVERTTTRFDGRYTFKVDPGRYHVSVDCPPGYTISRGLGATSTSRIDPTTKSSDPFTIEASKAITGLDCGCYKPPSVSGVVFKDANMDGSQTASVEKGIPNIEVQLSKGTDSTFRLTAITDDSGQYSFTNLQPGEYSLTFITPGEYHHSMFTGSVLREKVHEGGEKGGRRVGVKTEALARSQPKTKPNGMKEASVYVTLSSGDRAIVDQGLYTLSNVEGVVFEDTNADGMWSDGEKILPNVEVTLFRSPQTVVGKTRSNEHGEYRFPDLEPGEYFVSFDLSSPEYKHSAKKRL